MRNLQKLFATFKFLSRFKYFIQSNYFSEKELYLNFQRLNQNVVE